MKLFIIVILFLVTYAHNTERDDWEIVVSRDLLKFQQHESMEERTEISEQERELVLQLVSNLRQPLKDLLKLRKELSMIVADRKQTVTEMAELLPHMQQNITDPNKMSNYSALAARIVEIVPNEESVQEEVKEKSKAVQRILRTYLNKHSDMDQLLRSWTGDYEDSNKTK